MQIVKYCPEGTSGPETSETPADYEEKYGRPLLVSAVIPASREGSTLRVTSRMGSWRLVSVGIGQLQVCTELLNAFSFPLLVT